jgi:uncharacterized phage protein (TIGR02218 family)
MTDFPTGLAEHLKQAVTTLCHCWRLTRRGGVVLGFTDHDYKLSCDGTVFRPETGFSASEARSSLDLAVDTVDVEGALSSADLSEEDIAAGVYDGARVETLLVNWSRPEEFALLRQAMVGKIERRDGSFVAELESVTASLDQANGRTIKRRCDAELGDARCTFDTGRDGFHAAGIVEAVEGNDTLVVTGLDGFDVGWFSNGLLTWTSGADAGRTERVVSHRARDADGILGLWSEHMASVRPGDAFSIVAGCDKQFSTCKAKFANVLNFRGFPHLPGNDSAYSYVNENGSFDGGPIVE